MCFPENVRKKRAKIIFFSFSRFNKKCSPSIFFMTLAGTMSFAIVAQRISLWALACCLATGTLCVAGEPVNAAENAAFEAARERNRVSELSAIESERKAVYAEIAARNLPELEASRRLAPLAARYENFLARFPEDADGLVLYAKFLRDGGADAEAENYFRKVLALRPGWAVIRQQLAALAAEQGALAEALTQMQKAVELEPGTLVYQMQFGELLAASRERALEAKIFPDAGALDAALQNAFRAARALAPERLDVAVRYAESFYDVEKPTWALALEAWDYVERLLRKQPEFGTKSAAETFFRETLALHRARAYAELGNASEAEKLLRSSKDKRLEASREKIQKIISENQKT